MKFLRVRPEMNRLISKSCDPSRKELDAGDHEPGRGAGDGRLEVLGETAVAAEPGESALHHPTPGQDLEARHAVASLDDLQPPLADLLQRLAEFRSGVGAIGEDLARISQTYLGDLSNWADKLGPWRRLGSLETVRTRVDRMTSVSKKISRHGRGRGHAGTGRVAARPGLDGGQLASAMAGRRVPDRHKQARTRSARGSPRPWRT